MRYGSIYFKNIFFYCRGMWELGRTECVIERFGNFYFNALISKWNEFKLPSNITIYFSIFLYITFLTNDTR